VLIHLVTAASFLVATLWFVADDSVAADEKQKLGRTFEKLKKEKKLTIGYFGGSITAGAGASDGSKTSWRALTTAWFKDRFPAASITEANAAIGGTGSDLGAFRYQVDLFTKDPDLVFVEFAVNDGNGAELRVKRSMEGIVRQIWLANPWAEIVFIYTTTKALAPAYVEGGVPKAVSFHQAIAKHYDIPEINVGRIVVERITRGEGTWETLTTDGVHPNDAGYAIYGKTVQDFLDSQMNESAGEPRLALPDPLTKDPFSGGHLVDAATLYIPGWQKEEKSMGGRFPHFVASNSAGTELVHKFSGSTIGVYWLIAPDGGDIEWSIDGGEPKRVSSWDKYSVKNARAGYVIFADDLSAGEHTLKIRVLGDKKPESQGTWIRIGALLVHCPC